MKAWIKTAIHFVLLLTIVAVCTALIILVPRDVCAGAGFVVLMLAGIWYFYTVSYSLTIEIYNNFSRIVRAIRENRQEYDAFCAWRREQNNDD